MLYSCDLTMHELTYSPDYLYSVNNYQRFYVWDKNKVNTYLSDIMNTISRSSTETVPKHFFGQFIYIETSEDRRGRHIYEIIDGQQRLTTYMFLLAALSGAANSLAIEHTHLADNLRSFVEECATHLYSKKANAQTLPKFSLSPRDNDYYQAIIGNLINNSEVLSRDNAESEMRLFDSQDAIKQWLNQILLTQGTPEEKYDILKKIKSTACDKFQIVVLKPQNKAYTYRLYQVVNDRGEPLKDSELLKAKTIEVLSQSLEYLTEAEKIWDDILSDSGKQTDEFLKYCYLAKLGKDKSHERYYRSYIDEYFHIPDNVPLSDEQITAFMSNLRELYGDVLICRKLVKGIWPYETSTVQQWKRSILHNVIIGLRHTLCIPVLLNAYRQPAYHGVSSEENFYKCLELCETFFVLVKGVFKKREDCLKKCYLKAAREMRNTPEAYRSAHFKNDLLSIDPALLRAECQQRLEELTYNAHSNNPILKYLCILLETYWTCFDNRGRVVTSRVPDGTNLVFNELSLEHIYPKGLSGSEIDGSMEPYKNYIGNLMIFGSDSNSRLGNKKYEQKRVAYQDSRFSVANDVARENESWTIHEFQARQRDVCNKLKNILLRFHDSI